MSTKRSSDMKDSSTSSRDRALRKKNELLKQRIRELDRQIISTSLPTDFNSTLRDIKTQEKKIWSNYWEKLGGLKQIPNILNYKYPTLSERKIAVENIKYLHRIKLELHNDIFKLYGIKKEYKIDDEFDTKFEKALELLTRADKAIQILRADIIKIVASDEYNKHFPYFNKKHRMKVVNYITDIYFVYAMVRILFKRFRMWDYNKDCGHLIHKREKSCTGTAGLYFLFSLYFPLYKIQLCGVPNHGFISVISNNEVIAKIEYGSSNEISILHPSKDVHYITTKLKKIHTRIYSIYKFDKLYKYSKLVYKDYPINIQDKIHNNINPEIIPNICNYNSIFLTNYINLLQMNSINTTNDINEISLLNIDRARYFRYTLSAVLYGKVYRTDQIYAKLKADIPDLADDIFLANDIGIKNKSSSDQEKRIEQSKDTTKKRKPIRSDRSNQKQMKNIHPYDELDNM